jgi:glycosyltransferase involved in cell wall biosynthesis
MKIAQLVMARQFRGAEVFASQLSRELLALGAEVRYITLYQNSGTLFTPHGIEILELNEIKKGRLSFRLIRKVAHALKQFNPEVVQANAGDTLKYAVLAKLLFRLKYKIVFRNASTVSQYIKSVVQKVLNSFLYRNTDHIISVSKGSLDDFCRTFPFCKTKIVWVPNGISIAPLLKESIFNSDTINLVHVGGFTFEKNHRGLLNIFVKVKKHVPAAKLWLIGEGPLKREVEQEVLRLGLSDVVTFLGAQEKALAYIASASMLVLPSRIEGLPGVILEAMYCRTPVVANNVGGISEVVKNGETGWLVNAGDEDGFVAAIQEVLQATNLGAITEHAYNHVVQEYDNHAIAKRFLEVYKKVASH